MPQIRMNGQMNETPIVCQGNQKRYNNYIKIQLKTHKLCLWGKTVIYPGQGSNLALPAQDRDQTWPTLLRTGIKPGPPCSGQGSNLAHPAC